MELVTAYIYLHGYTNRGAKWEATYPSWPRVTPTTCGVLEARRRKRGRQDGQEEGKGKRRRRGGLKGMKGGEGGRWLAISQVSI